MEDAMAAEIRETELTFARAGDVTLQAVLYEPSTSTGAMLIDVHGGAWSSGHRKTGRHYDRLIAATGTTVLAIDFRQGPEHHHPAASADINAAVRFARANCQPRLLGLIGSSSGGHLALHAALMADDPRLGGTAIAAGDTFVDSTAPATVDFVIAMWPVSNPLARYQYANFWRARDAAAWGPNFAPDRLHAGHEAYFGNEAAMADATIHRILAAGEHRHLPPVFIVQPELDLNVPVFMSETLAGALMHRGGEVTYKLYPGVAHGFAHAPGEQTDRCIADIAAYVARALATR